MKGQEDERMRGLGCDTVDSGGMKHSVRITSLERFESG